MKKDFKNKQVFAKKSLGQNFLSDPNYVEKIVNSLNLRAGEIVLEIGPGRGALTKNLIEHGAEVVAIEIDRDLIGSLRQEFQNCPNFHLIEADALKVNFQDLLQQTPVKIVANLPYYISTAILQKIIREREFFSEAVLMLQREVVERIIAAPGNTERGFLTVLIEAYCLTQKLFDVPPSAFRPAPKIWSSVMKVEFLKPSPITTATVNEALFTKIVSAGFSQKRKTILNNLKNIFADLSNKNPSVRSAQELLEQADVNANARAEDLTLEEWICLVKVLS